MRSLYRDLSTVNPHLLDRHTHLSQVLYYLVAYLRTIDLHLINAVDICGITNLLLS